jgi:predicted nucleic acid-binding protein
MTIFETLTVLKKLKQSDEVLKKVYKQLIAMTVLNDTIFYKETLEHTFINTIGFFENLTYRIMINTGIGEIVSFDEDFNII